MDNDGISLEPFLLMFNGDILVGLAERLDQQNLDEIESYLIRHFFFRLDEVELRQRFYNTLLGISMNRLRSVEMAKFFMEKKGADINYICKSGHSFLTLAITDRYAENNNIIMIKFISENCNNINHIFSGNTCGLSLAMICDKVNIFDVLVEAGSDINILTSKGDNLLGFLARCKISLQFAEKLLQLGVDPFHKNFERRDCLNNVGRYVIEKYEKRRDEEEGDLKKHRYTCLISKKNEENGEYRKDLKNIIDRYRK